MKKFSEEWWGSLLSGKSGKAMDFDGNTDVFSNYAVRSIVLEAIKRTSQPINSADGKGKCSVPMWRYPGVPAGFCCNDAYGFRPEGKT